MEQKYSVRATCDFLFSFIDHGDNYKKAFSLRLYLFKDISGLSHTDGKLVHWRSGGYYAGYYTFIDV
jgi:hypothetical protein